MSVGRLFCSGSGIVLSPLAFVGVLSLLLVYGQLSKRVDRMTLDILLPPFGVVILVSEGSFVAVSTHWQSVHGEEK